MFKWPWFIEVAAARCGLSYVEPYLVPLQPRIYCPGYEEHHSNNNNDWYNNHYDDKEDEEDEEEVTIGDVTVTPKVNNPPYEHPDVSVVEGDNVDIGWQVAIVKKDFGIKPDHSSQAGRPYWNHRENGKFARK